MFVFEAGKILTINCVMLKGIQTRLTPNRAHVIDKKKKKKGNHEVTSEESTILNL